MLFLPFWHQFNKKISSKIFFCLVNLLRNRKWESVNIWELKIGQFIFSGSSMVTTYQFPSSNEILRQSHLLSGSGALQNRLCFEFWIGEQVGPGLETSWTRVHTWQWQMGSCSVATVMATQGLQQQVREESAGGRIAGGPHSGSTQEEFSSRLLQCKFSFYKIKCTTN
jgi:hypothetical protein